MEQMNSPSEIAMNMPNASMTYQTYTPIFGNLGFMIMPSQSGSVSSTFGTIPAPPSLEGLIYMQQMNAQVTPVNVLPGQNTGQQNIQGTYTSTDQVGNIRVAMGSGGSSSSTAGTY